MLYYRDDLMKEVTILDITPIIGSKYFYIKKLELLEIT